MANQEFNNFTKEVDDMTKNYEDIVTKAKNLVANIPEEENQLKLLKNKIVDLIQSTCADKEMLSDEKERHNNNCAALREISNEYRKTDDALRKLQNLQRDIEGIMNPTFSLYRTVKIFVDNYMRLLNDAYILKKLGQINFITLKLTVKLRNKWVFWEESLPKV